MPESGRHKFLRTGGVVLLCLLVAAGIGWVWLGSNYKRIIQQKLPALSAKVTDSLYQIKAGDVSIDLLARKVVVTDFELVPDAEHIARLKRDFDLPELLLKIHIDRIVMDDIAWGEVLRTKEIVCGSMEILNPVVRITRLADNPEDATKERKPSSIQAIKAARIAILNPDVRFQDGTAKTSAAYAVKGGRIDLSDWQYDLRQPNDTNRLFYASNTAFRLDTFFIHQPGALSKIGSGRISYDQAAGTIGINNLSIVPAVTKEQFYKRVGYQKELYDVHVPSISFQGIDWKGLLLRGALIAGGGKLSDAAINIYMSRVPPLNTISKNGKFPQQLLMKLKMPVFIPRLDIANAGFAYTEKNHKTMMDGTVAMQRINGALQNITNMPARLRANNICTIGLRGIFKGSDIEATFRLRIDSRQGAFTLDGQQSAMDGTLLNDITRPLALAEIRSLRLNGIRFHVAGDESGAQGSLTMRYEHLTARLQEVEDGGLDKKDVTSFLANALLIHRNNPEPGKALRIAHPSLERDETKSFFNLVWKNIFTGALQTVSRNVVKLDKMVNNRQKKQEEKRKAAELNERNKSLK